MFYLENIFLIVQLELINMGITIDRQLKETNQHFNSFSWQKKSNTTHSKGDLWKNLNQSHKSLKLSY